MTVPGGHNESGDGCVCGCMVLGVVVARESVGGAFLTSRLKKRQRIHDSQSHTRRFSPYEPSTIPHLSAGSDALPSILLI